MTGGQDARSDSFNELLEQNLVPLQRFLRRQLAAVFQGYGRPLRGDDLDAEVQALILAIIQARANYDPGKGGFRAWANKIAMRRLADRERQFYREHRRPRVMSESCLPAEETFDLLMAAASDRRCGPASDDLVGLMMGELNQLPQHYQAAVRLRYLEGLSYQAIGARLGVTVGAAKGDAFRGFVRLSQRMHKAAAMR